MEHKINDIITYNHNGETIYLKVIEDFDCKNCFFYSTACCSDIRNDVGDCLSIRRSDKTPIIFKKVNNKTMNENIDLTKILKDCPIGWEFYSPMLGDVVLHHVNNKSKRVYIIPKILDTQIYINANGTLTLGNVTSKEIMLYPSKEIRDWSKFTAPWYKKDKKDKFDPNTLKPFDKVLVRISNLWRVNFFSNKEDGGCRCININYSFKYCIPYNDETKHLVGTTDEAPEYYRYWEE